MTIPVQIRLVVKKRLYEVCPQKMVDELDEKSLKNSTNVAFKIIGYEPRDMLDSIKEARTINRRDGTLAEFIYDVWRVDNGSN